MLWLIRISWFSCYYTKVINNLYWTMLILCIISIFINLIWNCIVMQSHIEVPHFYAPQIYQITQCSYRTALICILIIYTQDITNIIMKRCNKFILTVLFYFPITYYQRMCVVGKWSIYIHILQRHISVVQRTFTIWKCMCFNTLLRHVCLLLLLDEH